MAASRTGRIEAVRLLLARGAKVNAADGYQQQTSLMWAAAEGHAGGRHAARGGRESERPGARQRDDNASTRIIRRAGSRR